MDTRKAWIATAVAPIVIGAMLQAAPSQAAPVPSGTGRPPVLEAERLVRGGRVPVAPRIPDPSVGEPAPVPGWPVAAGAAVRASDGARVQVLDREVARRAGVGGLIFTLDRAGATTLRVDYSAFDQAYGGSYGSRLRLVRLPACVLTAPQRPGCRTATTVPSRNDAVSRTLTADIGEAGDAAGTTGQTAAMTVLAAVAGPSSDQGDYRATSLSPSAVWRAGANSGEFTWSYPMRVPPVPGGLAPDLAIGYSSASIDGRTANTNNQPSWVGEGFDLWPGYIERSYQGCADDGAPKSNGVDPGDLCWAYDNATVTWNGKGGELIKAGDGSWRLRNDDGTRFEKLTSGGQANGDDNGEYWKATTLDGTQYFFGLHRLPDWTDGKAQTDSTWTAPVFGDDSGEPCHDEDGFAQSWCQQAWRWNLDYVVDTNGNAIAYYYVPESNKYGRNVDLSADTGYERGGYLSRIEYGLRADDLFAGAPARVHFTTAERCLPGGGFDCAPSKIGDNPQKWPDVPWDQNCVSDCAGSGLISPTFWSRHRLTGVTTQIRQLDGTYRDIDSWELTHGWGDADIDRALLLVSIQHTGKAGDPAVALPKVTFNHIQLKNRLDRIGDDIPPFIKYRLGRIYDESGGQLEISYSDADCTLADLPTPETNTRRCFPVYWQPAGKDEPVRDWFHKYVVTQVIQSDRTAAAPDMVTGYEYLGGAAWHFADDDGLSKAKYKTWSQWRGYGRIRVTTGGFNDPLTRQEYLYLRGMNGDRLNPSGGTKSVTVTDGDGGTHTDHESLAGFELQHTVYTGPAGTVHSRTVNVPWRHQTASRSRSWGTVTANLTGVATTRTVTALDGGAWRQTRVDTAHDPVTGLPTQVDDQGDTAIGRDDLCTRTWYAVNATAWIRSLPSRVETVSVRCSATPNRATDVVSDVRTYYDGGALGAAPIRGEATRVEKIAAHDGATARYVATARTVYDAYGRPTAVTDAVGSTTTTSYADTAGLTTTVTTTSPPVVVGDPVSAHVRVRRLDPAWGQPTADTDVGGKTTSLAYDALGRLTKVWRPGRAGATVADLEYVYQVVDGQIVAITTKTVTAGGGQRISHELFDGFLRSRQTQAAGPGGGRLVTDTFYDSRGNVARRNGRYHATGAPDTALFGVAVPGEVASQITYAYDGLNRVTVERFLVGGNDTQEKWRTVTSYGGGWVAVDPPDGGTPTVTVTDARGRTTELRQYRGSTPAGAYDSIRYAYHPDGRPDTITDAAGQVWSYTYDLRGRLVKATDPDRGTTLAGYDDANRLASTTDARGQRLVYSYDVLGRRTETRDGSVTGALRASWVYDTVRKGQLTSATRYAGGQAYTTRVGVYDNRNRPVRVTVTVPAAEGVLAGSYTFSAAYNLDGTVRSRGFPAAGGLPAETVGYTYDDVGRPTRVTSNLGSYVNATVYSALGQPLQYELTTGGKRTWQTFTWEYGTGRLATARTDREGISGVDRNAAYRYDPAGNIAAISDVSRHGTRIQCFRYDHVRRLVSAWSQGTTTCASTPSTSVIGGPAPYWHDYTYDGAGNRETETLHGTGGQTDTVRTYANEGHRLTGVAQSGGAGVRSDAFGYDAAGNMTTRSIGATRQTLTWDAEGRLATVAEGSSTVSFGYDAGGNRLLRRDGGGRTLYLPGMELRASAGGSVVSGTRYYRHHGETLAMRTVTGVRFLSNDHQGTAQLAVDAASQAVVQRRFTPFGSVSGAPAGVWPDEKTFVGGTRDGAVGLTSLGARQYDPAIGRFISADPLLLFDDPQQVNGYGYANYSPVTWSDPSGLSPCGGGWQLASTVTTFRDCDQDYLPPPDYDRDYYPPSSGGGGGYRGGGGGYRGGGYRGGGGGGYRPPPIGPIRRCEGWCAIRDKIGDHQGGMRGTRPRVAEVLGCIGSPNSGGGYPAVRQDCGQSPPKPDSSKPKGCTVTPNPGGGYPAARTSGCGGIDDALRGFDYDKAEKEGLDGATRGGVAGAFMGCAVGLLGSWAGCLSGGGHGATIGIIGGFIIGYAVGATGGDMP